MVRADLLINLSLAQAFTPGMVRADLLINLSLAQAFTPGMVKAYVANSPLQGACTWLQPIDQGAQNDAGLSPALLSFYLGDPFA